MSAAPKAAMIMAAGFGTRMGALTANRPKPLLEVAGRSLIERTIDLCAEASVEKVVINLHYLGAQIRDALRHRNDLEIIFSEETEILETGGGVELALPHLGHQPFYTMNADAIWSGRSPLSALAGAWRPDMGALLHLAAKKNAAGYSRAGDFSLLPDNQLQRRGDNPSAPYVYTGAQIICPTAFEDAPGGAYSLNVIWDRLLAEGRLFGALHHGRWVDVGSPAGLEAAEQELGS